MEPTPEETTELISNFEDLCSFFSVDFDPENPIECLAMIHKHIYKYTNCGASISCFWNDGSVIFGGDAEDLTAEMVASGLKAITVQSIVEGWSGELDSDMMTLPIKSETLEGWIQWLEAEAKRVWHEQQAYQERWNITEDRRARILKLMDEPSLSQKQFLTCGRILQRLNWRFQLLDEVMG